MTTPQEIWSVRLQRELLALTKEPTQETGDDDNSNKNSSAGILPPFIQVKQHKLDIAKGLCQVYFNVLVEDVSVEDVTEPNDKDELALVEPKLNISQDEDETTTENEDATAEKESKEESPKKDKESSANVKQTVTVTILMDVSLDLSSNNSRNCYPFSKPKATLSSGSNYFGNFDIPIQNGDEILIDCDWTPSLHLNDAALNVALKVRESIKRGEPCLKIVEPELEENLATKANSFFSSLKTRASAMAEELDKAMEEKKPKLRTPLRRKGRIEQREVEEVSKKIVTPSNIEIGDEIDLSQEPWNEAVGMYPCKAIRRPEFIEEAIVAAAVKEDKNKKVGNSGLAGAGNMFKSFTQSAKTLVQESYLMLTEDLIIEIKCNKFSVANATITIAIPVSHLAKLKFRREESISLFFKQAPRDPIIYMCESSADAVREVQNVLKRHGVKGKHTNPTTQRSIQIALQTLSNIRTMEDVLETDPSPERVTEIMDMYRQVAEQFELAGDTRHKDAMTSMHEFLANPLVACILDGTYEKEEAQENDQVKPTLVDITSESKPKEVEDKSETQINKEEDEKSSPEILGKTEDEDVDFEKAMQDAEDMLKDAHIGLENLGIDETESEEYDSQALASTIDTTGISEDGSEIVSNFEDILKDADKELAELMDI